MMNRLEMVTTQSEQVLDSAMDHEEALRLTNRFELSHLSFLLSCRLMGDLGTVVLILTSPVNDRRKELSMGS